MEKKQINLDSLKPESLAEDLSVRERFIKVLTSIHKLSEEDAESIYDKESLYYKKAVLASSKLKTCTNISLYSSFLEIAITGLSIQPGNKSEAYLESRGAKQPDGTYINSAILQITAYGELNMRIRARQIIRLSNPIVLYEGDYFQPKTNERGELTIDYKPSIPRQSNTIIGCWVAIYVLHGGIDFKWLLKDDIQRLMDYSKKGMGGSANRLYTANGNQIDPGFLEAKTIKHAMRSYTKLRVGESVAFEDEEVETTEEVETFSTDDNAEVAKVEQSVEVKDNEDIF